MLLCPGKLSVECALAEVCEGAALQWACNFCQLSGFDGFDAF